MEPEAPGAIAPRLVDGPLEKIAPQALADELWHEPELHQLDLTFRAPIQLGETCRDTVGHQDVDFELGVVQESGEFGVRELLTAGPILIPTHGIVQEAIVGNGRPLGVDHDKPFPRRGDNPLRVGEHLQVGGFDHYALLPTKLPGQGSNR
jgi:hypothetical protein